MGEVRELRAQLNDPRSYWFALALDYAIGLMPMGVDELCDRMISRGFHEDLACEVIDCIAVCSI